MPWAANAVAISSGVVAGTSGMLVAHWQASPYTLNAVPTGHAHARKAAPTVSGGRLYVVTIDNQLNVLDADSGEKKWTHTAISESAGLLGGGSVAVDGSTVAVPYSSGEIFAMRAENGRVVWSDNLTAIRRIDAMASLAHIRGSPVIDRGVVYAISHSGRLVAIDQRSGARIWERSIGGVDMPWVAGEFIFVLSNENEIYCLTRQGGRVRWVQPLPR